MKSTFALATTFLALLSAPSVAQDSCNEQTQIAVARQFGDSAMVAFLQGLEAKCRAEVRREAVNARIRAQLPGPSESSLCAGRMTRDGCQPK